MVCSYYRANGKCLNGDRKVFYVFKHTTCGFIFNYSNCSYFVENVKPEIKVNGQQI